MKWSFLLRSSLTNVPILMKPLTRPIYDARKTGLLIAASGLVLSSTLFVDESAFCDSFQHKLPAEVDNEISIIRSKLIPATNYERIDSRLQDDSHKAWLDDHVLHDTLKGPGKVEAYEVYLKRDTNEIICIVKFGKSLNGYPKIVHGGITSLIFDNTYGWLFMALQQPPAVTANLVVNFRY